SGLTSTHSRSPARPPLTLFSLFFFYGSPAHRYLHSFPTRRSSDLIFLGTISAMRLAENACPVAGSTEFGAVTVIGLSKEGNPLNRRKSRAWTTAPSSFDSRARLK